MDFEFLIPRRPLSLQTRNRQNMRRWKAYVSAEAARTWTGPPCTGVDVHLTLVYLYAQDPIDVDNIVKPIQDALSGVVYADDLCVTDVECHRRQVNGVFDVTRCPRDLIQGIVSGNDCVYVKVSASRPLEVYL